MIYVVARTSHSELTSDTQCTICPRPRTVLLSQLLLALIRYNDLLVNEFRGILKATHGINVLSKKATTFKGMLDDGFHVVVILS